MVAGTTLAGATLGLTLLLECTSLSATRACVASPGGRDLYKLALGHNLFNTGFVGPVVWDWTVAHLCGDTTGLGMSVGVVAVHAVGYYSAHRMLHTRRLYRFHELHHRFHSIVVPMAANCVSTVEYLVAYMLPFVVGAWLLRPTVAALALAAAWVSVCNLLVHAPVCHAPAKKWVPKYFVGTHDHLFHHSHRTTKFAAPTLNVDAAVAWFHLS